jgi:hypothetical protein
MKTRVVEIFWLGALVGAGAVFAVMMGCSSFSQFPATIEDHLSLRVLESVVEQEAEEPQQSPLLNNGLKVPFPIFVASLYKSGTTTVHSYFQCGQQRSVHYAGQPGRRTGPCLKKRIQAGLRPVFEGCGGEEFDIFTDNAHLQPPHSCFDPSVHGLDAIYESYPNATILLTVRDSTRWLDSVTRYRWEKQNWSLLNNLLQCSDLWPTQRQDLGNRSLTEWDLKAFYNWHTEHVRNFARAHPSMTYVEVSLESDSTGQQLEDAIGIPATCWGHANKNTRIPSGSEAS